MKKIILIVDDEIDLLRCFNDFFTVRGYEVLFDTMGCFALETIRRHHPPAIILDLKLLDMDAESIIKDIKEISPETKIIIYTAYRDEQTKQRIEKIGVYAYFYKPASLQELKETIEKATL